MACLVVADTLIGSPGCQNNDGPFIYKSVSPGWPLNAELRNEKQFIGTKIANQVSSFSSRPEVGKLSLLAACLALVAMTQFGRMRSSLPPKPSQ